MRKMSSRGFFLAQVAVVLATFLLTAWCDSSAVAAVAPAALFFLALFSGLMPGEELLERLRQRRAQARPRRRRPARLTQPLLLVVRRVVAQLSRSALAMRPPPAAA